MGTSGSNVVVNVSSSNFTGNQAIAAMPSSTSTGNLFAGIAVGGAIENDYRRHLQLAHQRRVGQPSPGAVPAERTVPAARPSAAGSAVSWVKRPST